MKIHPAHALLPAILMAIIVLVVVTQNLGSVQAMGVAQENQSIQAKAELDENANQAFEPLNKGECGLSLNYSEVIRTWCGLIENAAQANNLDPNLIAAVMQVESAGNQNAYSSSGAVGLMQVMPRDGLAASFQCVNGPCFADRPSSDQLFDPQFNVQYGSALLAGYIQANFTVRDGLFAYGPMDVGYSYADHVLAIYAASQPHAEVLP